MLHGEEPTARIPTEVLQLTEQMKLLMSTIDAQTREIQRLQSTITTLANKQDALSSVTSKLTRNVNPKRQNDKFTPNGRPICNICDEIGHIARRCKNRKLK
jgi:predicted RNase H-like nuclease (RuvC/YqgF family)